MYVLSSPPFPPVLYSSTVILCEWDHSWAHPPQQHNLCWDGDQTDRLPPQWSGHSQLQPYTRCGSILPRCILLHHTNSCRMKIEHGYIYVHNIFDVCTGQHDPFSPTSKLKVNIILLACRCKFYIFCFQFIQLCNHTYCLLMEIMVPFTILTSMQVALSS